MLLFSVFLYYTASKGDTTVKSFDNLIQYSGKLRGSNFYFVTSDGFLHNYDLRKRENQWTIDLQRPIISSNTSNNLSLRYIPMADGYIITNSSNDYPFGLSFKETCYRSPLNTKDGDTLVGKTEFEYLLINPIDGSIIGNYTTLNNSAHLPKNTSDFLVFRRIDYQIYITGDDFNQTLSYSNITLQVPDENDNFNEISAHMYFEREDTLFIYVNKEMHLIKNISGLPIYFHGDFNYTVYLGGYKMQDNSLVLYYNKQYGNFIIPAKPIKKVMEPFSSDEIIYRVPASITGNVVRTLNQYLYIFLSLALLLLYVIVRLIEARQSDTPLFVIDENYAYYSGEIVTIFKTSVYSNELVDKFKKSIHFSHIKTIQRGYIAYEELKKISSIDKDYKKIVINILYSVIELYNNGLIHTNIPSFIMSRISSENDEEKNVYVLCGVEWNSVKVNSISKENQKYLLSFANFIEDRFSDLYANDILFKELVSDMKQHEGDPSHLKDHFAFKDQEFLIQFFSTLSDTLLHIRSQRTNLDIVADFEKGRLDVMRTSDWFKVVKQDTLLCVESKDSSKFNGDSITDLIRFTRNKTTHSMQNNLNNQEVLQIIFDYFPNFLMHCYRCYRKNEHIIKEINKNRVLPKNIADIM